MATDNFNRADGALGVNWTGIAGNVPTVNTNACAGMSGGGDHGAFYSGASFANDQYSEGTLTALTSGASYIGVLVRGSSGNCYGFYASTTDSYLFKVVSNTWTQLGATGPAFANNDVIRIEISSSSITCKKNGSASGMPSATGQTDIASGSPGIFAYEGTASRIDDWTGADLTAGATARTIAFSIARLQRVSRLRRLLRNASEIRTQSSRVSRLRNLIRSLGFTKQANSVVSRLRRLTRTIRTSLASLSVVQRLRRLARTISKSTTISLRVQRIASYIRTILRPHSIASLVSRARITVRNAIRLSSISSQVKRIGMYIRTVRAITALKSVVSQSLVGGVIFVRSIALSMATSSRASRLTRYLRTVYLGWNYGYDSGGYEEGQYNSGGSGRVPSFSVSRIGIYIRTLRAIRSASYSVSRALIGLGLYLRNVSTSIVSASRVSRIGTYIRRISEIISHSATVSRLKLLSRNISLSIARLSTVKRIGSYLRSVSVSVRSNFSLSRIAKYTRRVSLSIRQSASAVRTVVGAVTLHARSVVASIIVSARVSGNPILRLIYKIFSSFDTKITSFSSSQSEIKDKISSTTKEVD